MIVGTILCEVIIIICDINTINRAGHRVNLTTLWARATTDQNKFISIKKKKSLEAIDLDCPPCR